MTRLIDGYKSQQEPRTPEQRWNAFEFPMLEPCGVRHWRTEHLGYVLVVDGVAYSAHRLLEGALWSPADRWRARRQASTAAASLETLPCADTRWASPIVAFKATIEEDRDGQSHADGG